MANYQNQIYDLEQLKNVFGNKNSIDTLTESRQKEILRAFSLGYKYYEQYYEIYQQKIPARDHQIVDQETFRARISLTEIQSILDYFRKLAFEKPENKQKEENDEREEKEQESAPPTKEDQTVPAELETLVATYKTSQADKIEEDSTHTVANAVKRARKAWESKHRTETIIKNRTENQKEEADEYFVEKVDPKSENKRAIYKNVENIARQAVIVQASKLGIPTNDVSVNKAIENLTDLGLSGAVDFTNFKELNVISEWVFKVEGKNISTELNKVDDAVLAWQHEIKTNPYSDKPDTLEKEIVRASNIAQVNINSEAEKFEEKLKRNYTDKTDLQDEVSLAKKQIEKIQTTLLKAIPLAAVPKAEEITPAQAKEIEKVLRLSDSSTTLQINPEGMGARTAAVISTTNSANRNISPEAVRLYALGLTPAALDKMSNDPNSELNKYLKANPENLNVFQQVRFHISKIHESELGKEIQENLKLTPISGINSQITAVYNKLPPAVQTATKFILNPKGTIYAWANKKIGETIGKTLVKNVGSAAAQKLGNFILKEGLQKGISTFAKTAAEKVAIEVAKKIGITVVGESLVATVAVALGISTAGASLVIGAILIVGTEILKATFGRVKKGLDTIWVQLGWGDEFKTRDLIVPAVIVGTAAASAGAAFLGTLAITWRATQIAISSAIGIIIGAIAFAGFYVLMAFLVAPILSTLVQLDTKEKVDYSAYSLVASSSGECGWPTKGHYVIVTGPNGGTHYRSKLEAIDIGAPNASPLLSSTDGTVTFTGVYSNYGNTTIIQTKNSAGSFTVYHAHQSSIGVRVGQQVKKGQQIGLVGGSGGWSPHIHMEYKGIKYNKCPAGGLQIKEGCCIPYAGGICTGLCNAYSN